MPRFRLAVPLAVALLVSSTISGAVENGTRVVVSDYSYWTLITRLEAAIKKHKLRVVTRASVRGAARQRKLGIPGNMVIGAYSDDYAARILRANVAAGIEAPIRFFISRDDDAKTTTLWFRRPSWVLAQYNNNGDLHAVAAELDAVMEKIVDDATKRRPLMVKRAPKQRKGTEKKKQTTAVATTTGRSKRKETIQLKPVAVPALPAAPKQAAARPPAAKKAKQEGPAKAASAPQTGTATSKAGAPVRPRAPKSLLRPDPATAKPPVAKPQAAKPQPREAAAKPRGRSIEVSPLLMQLQGQ